MKTTKHGNGRGHDDLYILPDDHAEASRITGYLESKGFSYSWCQSDVEGQEWYGRSFIDVPFGEGMESLIREAASV